MTQPKFDLPNPQDWLDVAAAAELMNRKRPTVYDMIDRGVLTPYRVGRITIFWRPEVERVAGALRVLEAKQRK